MQNTNLYLYWHQQVWSSCEKKCRCSNVNYLCMCLLKFHCYSCNFNGWRIPSLPFFLLQIPPTNQYFWCTLHENYIFNKWKKYDVFYNGNLSTSFATSSILWWFFLVALSIRHMKGLDNHLFICLVFHRSFPLSWLYA